MLIFPLLRFINKHLETTCSVQVIHPTNLHLDCASKPNQWTPGFKYKRPGDKTPSQQVPDILMPVQQITAGAETKSAVPQSVAARQ